MTLTTVTLTNQQALDGIHAAQAQFIKLLAHDLGVTSTTSDHAKFYELAKARFAELLLEIDRNLKNSEQYKEDIAKEESSESSADSLTHNTW